MVAVLVLKALYPDLHVWILPIVAGIVWIVYARVVRAFGMVKSG